MTLPGKSIRLYKLILFLSFEAGVLFAQAPRLSFSHLSIKDGLSQNTVNDILQDFKGFIWIGTNDGLNRYNGYEFEIFKHSFADSNTLSHNKIYSLLEDRQQRLWVGTRKGLNLFDRQKDRFVRMNPMGSTVELANAFIRTLYKDSKGRIWVGTYGEGMFMFDGATFTACKIEPWKDRSEEFKAGLENVTSFVEDEFGGLWIGTLKNGLIYYNPETGEYRFFPFYRDKEITEVHGKTVYQDNTGRIWVCTEGEGLFLFDRVTTNFKHYPAGLGKNQLSHPIVKDIYEDDEGLLWLATDGGGLNIFDPENEIFKYYKYDQSNNKGLNTNALYSIFSDRQDIIWIGTFGDGLNVYDPNKKAFKHYTTGLKPGTGLSHKSVLCFQECENGNIWIGTDGGGLNYFNPKTGSFKAYLHQPNNPGSISSNHVTSLLLDNENRLWIGTFAGGLNYFRAENETFRVYRNEPENENSLINNNVWVMHQDSRDRIWVGTLGGLELFDPGSGAFVHISNLPQNVDQNLNRVTEIAEDHEGTIWIGGAGLWDIKDDLKIKRFRPGSEKQFSITEYDARVIYEDSTHDLWVGTEGGGLLKINPEKKSVRQYAPADGLPNEAVHNILEDDEGRLWISTNLGISRFDPVKEVFQNYDEEDGLQSNQFAYSAALKSMNGFMYFGGINGFNVFHPDSIIENPYIPPVILTDFTVSNKKVSIGTEDSPLSSHISEAGEITLTHDQSVFTFEFTALNFTSSEKNQYRYIMEGFESEWNEVSTKRTATYTNLDPGDYTFRVQASNNDGIWNEQGTSVQLHVLPPFWQTDLAYVLYALIIILTLLFFRQFIITRAQLKNDLKIKELEKTKIEEVNQMKLAFFTNISHEFRTPLTLIISPLEKMLSERKLDKANQKMLQIIYRNAERLRRLINQLIDFRRIEKGTMDLKVSRGDLVRYLKDIKTAFDEYARKKKVKYVFYSNVKELETWFDQDKLEKIFFNLLSNAFKYTPERGKIFFWIHAFSGAKDDPPGYSDVEIRIRDTGIGISKDQVNKIFDRFYQVGQATKQEDREGQGAGIGLSLTKDLVELHHGSITVESIVGRGSEFIVKIPLGKEHFKEEEILEEDRLKSSQISSRIYQVVDEKYESINYQKVTGEVSVSKGHEISVLVVEDNSDVRQFIRFSLEPAYHILEAENGKQGFEIASQQIPDIIITDIMMPVMDGIEMIEKIREDLRTSHIPLIVLTARSEVEDQLKGLEMGVEEYISKPFNPRLLALKIRNIIQNRRSLQDKVRKEIMMTPSEVVVASFDEKFLKKAMQVVEENIADPTFDVKAFVEHMGMSRSVLYRKLRSVTDQSANEFINTIRLKRAAQLLSQNKLTVSEVTYMVGFNDPQYFSKCFSKFYKVNPSQYAKQFAGSH